MDIHRALVSKRARMGCRGAGVEALSRHPPWSHPQTFPEGDTRPSAEAHTPEHHEDELQEEAVHGAGTARGPVGGRAEGQP